MMLRSLVAPSRGAGGFMDYALILQSEHFWVSIGNELAFLGNQDRTSCPILCLPVRLIGHYRWLKIVITFANFEGNINIEIFWLGNDGIPESFL